MLGLSSVAFGQKNNPNKMKNKTLVAYFSASGITAKVAVELAEVASADVYEIKPLQPYTVADLDWRNKNSRSSIEMKDKNSRPAITAKIDNMAQYETVYIGFPIWWYTAPTIINTFIEAYDLQNKTLIPFATSGGSTIAKSVDDLKRSYPSLHWEDGKLLNNVGRAELQEWVDSLK